MKVSRIIFFIIACCVSFTALLGVYAFVLFDIIMPKGETYNDPNNGLVIELPGGWTEENIMDNGTLVFSKGMNPFVFYEWGDYWQIIKPDASRSSEESRDSYDKYIRASYKLSPTLKTIGGCEYYTFRIVNGSDILLLAYHYDNGIEFKFSTLPESASDEFAFFRFLSFVSYPENWSDYNMLGSFETVRSGSGLNGFLSDQSKHILDSITLNKDADIVTLNIALLNLLFVFILFLIPLIICRSIFLKSRPGKKQALLASMTITLVTVAALAFSLYYTGVSLWFTLEALALWLITYNSIKPKAPSDTTKWWEPLDETAESVQSPETPEAANDTIELDLLQGSGAAVQETPKDNTDTSAAYCWHCGKPLRKGALFCPACGADLREP